MRGVILHHFCLFEASVNNIIRRSLFNNETEFDFYKDMFHKEEFSVNAKKKMVKYCIEKVEKKTSVDYSKLKSHLDDIFHKRNIMAHWIADTSQMGMDHFDKTTEIRFVKMRNYEPIQMEIFGEQSATSLVNRIGEALIDILKVEDEVLKSSQ